MESSLVRFVPVSDKPDLDLAVVAKSILDQGAVNSNILRRLDEIVSSKKSSFVARVFGKDAVAGPEPEEFKTLALAINEQMTASQRSMESLKGIYRMLVEKQNTEDRLRLMRAASPVTENPLKPVLRRAFHAVRRLHPKLKCRLIGCDYCRLCDEIGRHLNAHYLMQTNKVVEDAPE